MTLIAIDHIAPMTQVIQDIHVIVILVVPVARVVLMTEVVAEGEAEVVVQQVDGNSLIQLNQL